MKKLTFVTASVVALATAVPTFVPDVAAPTGRHQGAGSQYTLPSMR